MALLQGERHGAGARAHLAAGGAADSNWAHTHATVADARERERVSESFCVALAPLQVNVHEVTATFILHLLSRWDALNSHSRSSLKHMDQEDFVLLDEDDFYLDRDRDLGLPPRAGKAGSKQQGSRVVVRPTYLKLNLKRKYEGELESMQADTLVKGAHEAIVVNILMYYLETVPAFSLPGLAHSYAGKADWNAFVGVYSSLAASALFNQYLAQV